MVDLAKLKQMAETQPDDFTLKASGVLKLIGEIERLKAAPKVPEGWISARDRLPDGDGETVYIGINSNGFIGAFTTVTETASSLPGRGPYYNCYYDTAEEEVHVMNGLEWWMRVPESPLDVPSDAKGENNG